MQKCIESYIVQFKDLLDGQPWLDETFSKKLDNLSEDEVFTRAPDDNHSVAEVVWHITAWRNEYIRRLGQNSPDKMLDDESPDNWKDFNSLRAYGWPKIYADFKDSHRQLIRLLEDVNDQFLFEQLPDTKNSKEYYIAGLLQHDAYHLGQIGLILKWAKRNEQGVL